MLGLWIPSCRACLEQDQAGGRRETFKNPPPSSAPALPDGRMEEGRVRAHGGQQELLEGRSKIDEVIFQTYQNSDTMAQDLKAGNLQSAWNIPSRSSLSSATSRISPPSSASPPALTSSPSIAPTAKYQSQGNVVLTIPSSAGVQWAVDKEKITSIGYKGFRVRAARSSWTSTTARGGLPLDPAAGVAYTFDLEKAKAALDAAVHRH